MFTLALRLRMTMTNRWSKDIVSMWIPSMITLDKDEAIIRDTIIGVCLSSLGGLPCLGSPCPAGGPSVAICVVIVPLVDHGVNVEESDVGLAHLWFLDAVEEFGGLFVARRGFGVGWGLD